MHAQIIIPRDYQLKAATVAVRALINPISRPLIGLPTGSGKTIVIAKIISDLLDINPNYRFVIISHVKEILIQNYNTINKFTSQTSIGINSAGLDRRDHSQITIASIQSMFKDKEFYDYDFAIIDEAHTIPHTGEGRYNKFLDNFKGRVIGLTATPYRLGHGYIYGEGRIFTDTCIDYTQGDNFVQLIKDGFLCNLSIKHTSETLEVDKIKITGGDFDLKQMSTAFDREKLTAKVIDEIIEKGKDRKKWLLFAIDIEHAEHIAEELIRKGIRAMAVHSKLEFDRTKIIKMYKEGHYQAIVNVNVLTTGFDDEEIDLIGLIRPTTSPSLHVQMIGRGLRISEGKKDCLVLDFAGNTQRLGAINDIQIYNVRKRKKGEGEAICKVCPDCEEVVPAAVKICPSCGLKFTFKTRLNITSSNADLIVDGIQKPKWLKVIGMSLKIHKKNGSPNMIIAEYQTDLSNYKEYVCVEHKGYARVMASAWMMKHLGKLSDTSESLFNKRDALRTPNMIKVKRDGKYNKIIDYSF